MLQTRRLLLLEDPTDSIVQRQATMLESPLGLAEVLVAMAFHKAPTPGLLLAKQDLDSIKRVSCRAIKR